MDALNGELVARCLKMPIVDKTHKPWRVTAPLSPRHQGIYSLKTFVKIQSMLWSV